MGKPLSQSITGGKAGSGLDRWIVSQFPPHTTYVEAFLGFGAVVRLKKRARSTIVIDIDPAMTLRYEEHYARPGDTVLTGDALQLFWKLPLSTPDTLVYCDPPYLFSTRSCGRNYYRFEFGEEDQHEELLEEITSTRAMVAISGYRSELYDHWLATWRRVDRAATNRRGRPTLESLWMNYPEPEQLHDARFVGGGFRRREIVKRRRSRWIQRYIRMPAEERSSILSAMLEAEKELTGGDQLWRMLSNVKLLGSPDSAGGSGT